MRRVVLDIKLLRDAGASKETIQSLTSILDLALDPEVIVRLRHDDPRYHAMIKKAYKEILKIYDENVSETAKRLGIPRRTLTYDLRRYGLRGYKK